MAEDIKNVKLSFSCLENWNAMPDIEGGKYCDKCKKKVYDFTSKKAEEFSLILAENNYKICGKFSKEQLVIPPATAIWKKWIAAALVLIGFNHFLGIKAMAQTVPSEKPSTDTSKLKTLALPNDLFGGYEVSPEFPGGIEKFYAFIAQNVKMVKGPFSGKVIVTFTVEKDGSVSNVRALRGTNEVLIKETIRVVSLSPKWKPAMQMNKTISTQYTVPVIFN